MLNPTPAVTERRCGTCKVIKPISDFSPKKRTNCKDGYQSICKTCRNKTRPRYTVDTAITEKRCSKCKLIKPANDFCISPTSKGGRDATCKRCNYHRYQRNSALGKIKPSKQDPAKKRLTHLARKYGLTLETFELRMSEQKGKCFCGKTFETTFDICIDHDHACCTGAKSCGKCIRGLLCRHCNLAIGYAHDSPATLIKLAIYLKVFETQPVWLKRLQLIADRLS